jgi:hypothetical protein
MYPAFCSLLSFRCVAHPERSRRTTFGSLLSIFGYNKLMSCQPNYVAMYPTKALSSQRKILSGLCAFVGNISVETTLYGCYYLIPVIIKKDLHHPLDGHSFYYLPVYIIFHHRRHLLPVASHPMASQSHCMDLHPS